MNPKGNGLMKCIEVTLTPNELHPFYRLAKSLRQSVAVNFGKTVLVIHLPDGTEERYLIAPGANLDEYEWYMASTCKHTGTKQ